LLIQFFFILTYRDVSSEFVGALETGGRRTVVPGATSLPDRQMTLHAYSGRMWIDEMLGDLKKHGFDRLSTAQEERAILCLPDRRSCLTLDVALWYEWFISIGTKVIQNSMRHLINRNERRDLRIFQIGLRYIELR
jgi:hypothetical protein